MKPLGQAFTWSLHSAFPEPRTRMFLVSRPTSALAWNNVPSGRVTATPRWVKLRGSVRVSVRPSADTPEILLTSFSFWLCLDKHTQGFRNASNALGC